MQGDWLGKKILDGSMQFHSDSVDNLVLFYRALNLTDGFSSRALKFKRRLLYGQAAEQ